MIPSRYMLAALLLLTALALVPVFAPGLLFAWQVLAGVLLLVAMVDAGLAWFTPIPEIERVAPKSMSLATWTSIELTIRNVRRQRALQLHVADHVPQEFSVRRLPISARVMAGRAVTHEYQVRPTRRGRFSFEKADVRIASPLQLWWRKKTVPAMAEVCVYPNYATISQLLAYEVNSHLSLAGLRLRRRRGEGTEFHQLRDFREGDSIRAIDWKATSRMRRPIAREYQDERDQQIIFLLDSGRRMLAKDGDLSHFDQALNGMLLLSYVALRQGDAVGVMTIGQTRSWLPPNKGVGAINMLLNHVYDIEPSLAEIDYVRAATELAALQRRRSLVVVLTNVREEDTEDLKIAMDLLGRRHLVMLASLRERVLDETVAADIQTFDDALSYASTNAYLESRREAQDVLRAMGVMVSDCLSDELPAEITNRYLAIKRAGLL